MKILLTGINGYVGKSLYNALKNEHDITCISRKELDLTNGNYVGEFFKDKYFDTVIHCAISGGSRLKSDGSEVLDNNLLMYYNLYNNRNSFNRFISFGSGAEIYNSTTPYGLSKHIIAQSILNTPNFYNIRIYAVFDENELDTRFIKSNILNYIDKKPLTILQNKYMDFYYMKDLISLVKYYIKGEDLIKEIDCSYKTVNTLLNILHMINSLDTYKVPIHLKSDDLGLDYYSKGQSYEIPYKMYQHQQSNVGLELGIKEVFKKLKNGK